MGQIEWHESLSVHVDELDSQHREIFRLYNELHTSLLHDPLERIAATKIDTLHALIDYALRHFTSEERYLESRGYPGFESHRRFHREFTGRILTLQQDLAEQRPVLATTLIKLLRNWIFEHIVKDDQAFARYFENRLTAG